MNDGLTKLPMFDEFQEALRNRISAGHTSVVAIVFDFDGLIWINDFYGWAEADSAVVKIAEMLTGLVAAANADVYRTGGDEFAVLMPEGSENSAVDLARQAIRSSQQLGIPYQRSDRPEAIATLNAVIAPGERMSHPDHHAMTDFVQECVWSVRKDEPERQGVIADLTALDGTWAAGAPAGTNTERRRVKYAVKIQSARDQGEDRAQVIAIGDTTVVIVADGAGGMGGGAEAADEVVRQIADEAHKAGPVRPSTVAGWIENVDRQLSTSRSGGQCTVVVVVVSPTAIFGASVGDSEAWLIGEDADVLTEEQVRKPLVGSGQALTTVFERERSSGLLVTGTDGLFKYVSRESIIGHCGRFPIDELVEELVNLARLPSGGFQDDVAVAVTDCDDDAAAYP